MEIVTNSALTSVSTAVVNKLNSKLILVRKMFQDYSSNPGSALVYGIAEKGNTSIITLAGSIDATVAPELHELLVGCISREMNIIICMSDVLNFDTAGAATMLDVYAVARSHALGFVLVAVNLNARHTMSFCCLNHVLPMCKCIEDAAQYIQSH